MEKREPSYTAGTEDCGPRACALRREATSASSTCATPGGQPLSPQLEKHSLSNENPAQLKRNKRIYILKRLTMQLDVVPLADAVAMIFTFLCVKALTQD